MFLKQLRRIAIPRSVFATMLVLTAGMTVLSSSPAVADNHNVTCAEYAAAAVFRARENAKLGCGFKGGRWTDDHAGHLNWCQTSATKQLIHRELDIRVKQMQACKAKIAQSNEGPCRLYAIQAVAQNGLNRDYKCGFKGGNWSDNKQGHQNWCVKVGYKTAKARASDWRNRKLDECKSKPIVYSPAWGGSYRGERLPVDVCSRNSKDSSNSPQMCGKGNAQLFCTLKGNGDVIKYSTAWKDKRAGTFSVKADLPVSWYLDTKRPCFGKCSYFSRVVCKRIGT